MYKVRGDTLHCFRVEIPACVCNYHPSSLCCPVKAVKVKCLSCIGEEKFDCVAIVSYLSTPQ